VTHVRHDWAESSADGGGGGRTDGEKQRAAGRGRAAERGRGKERERRKIELLDGERTHVRIYVVADERQTERKKEARETTNKVLKERKGETSQRIKDMGERDGTCAATWWRKRLSNSPIISSFRSWKSGPTPSQGTTGYIIAGMLRGKSNTRFRPCRSVSELYSSS